MKVVDDDRITSDDLVDKVFVDKFLPISPSYTRNTYTGKYGQGSITLEFSVVCANDYYGASCTKHCRYTDSSAGHYKCNSDGSKSCLKGWSNPSGNCLKRM